MNFGQDDKFFTELPKLTQLNYLCFNPVPSVFNATELEDTFAAITKLILPFTDNRRFKLQYFDSMLIYGDEPLEILKSLEAKYGLRPVPGVMECWEYVSDLKAKSFDETQLYFT